MDKNNLLKYEKKIYSQNGEDGIIEEIFKRIGTDSKFAVEFGVEDGTECNTRLLKNNGWKVLQMDGGNNNPSSIKKEFIDAENINLLFKKYKVPNNLDLLSIDIDSNDFWVWKEVDERFKPRLVVVEYNATISPGIAKTIKYDKNNVWDGVSDYFGASLKALYNLGQIKGYSLVYCDVSGVNAFFVREDLLNRDIKALKPRQVYKKYGHVKPLRSKNKMVRLKRKDYYKKGEETRSRLKISFKNLINNK